MENQIYIAVLIELSSNVETNNGSQLIDAVSASIENAKIKTVFENAAKSEIEVFGVIK